MSPQLGSVPGWDVGGSAHSAPPGAEYQRAEASFHRYIGITGDIKFWRFLVALQPFSSASDPILSFL